MPRLVAHVRCPIHPSFRVQQIAGMFDVPLASASERSFEVELPNEDEDWRIGVIVGPSGSGKTTVARQYVALLAASSGMYECGDWPRDKAVIDGFGDAPTKRIVQALTAVGFSSPPAWLRPYHVLSGGERFRCDLARALLSSRSLVVFDEFTSVVDRTVAHIGAAAVAKAVRRGWFDEEGRGEEGHAIAEKVKSLKPRVSVSPRPRVSPRRFVAVTCHYDVLDWLEPDWVLDMAGGTLARRRLRQCQHWRPAIELEVFRCHHAAWRVFGSHHYLSGELNKSARCYLGTWEDQPVAFCGLLNCIGLRGVARISRIVVLPDYQGLGVGGRFCDEIGRLNLARGVRTTITTSHPAMLHHLRHSPRWRIRSVHKGGHPWNAFGKRKRVRASSAGRTVVGAEYVDCGVPSRDDNGGSIESTGAVV